MGFYPNERIYAVRWYGGYPMGYVTRQILSEGVPKLLESYERKSSTSSYCVLRVGLSQMLRCRLLPFSDSAFQPFLFAMHSSDPISFNDGSTTSSIV